MSDADIPFREIAEYTYDWETWVSTDGRTQWVNMAVTRMTGYSVSECLTMPGYPLPLVCEEDRARVRTAHDSAARGEAGNDLEFRILCKNGQIRWGAMSWQSIFDDDGERLGFRTSVRNIDERKRFEARLLEAKRRAEMADQAKTSFLAGVSHELRTPLQSLSGQAELLRTDDSSAEQSRRAEIIIRQAQLLQDMVEELLDLSGAELGRVRLQAHLQATDVVQVVAEVVDATRPRLGKRTRLSLERLDALPQAYTDGRRLAQIIRNLLDNAIRVTSDGEIRVRFSTQRGWVHVSVEDTGPGLDPTVLAALGHPFVRGTDPATHGRLGLGLSIAYRLADTMGARIEVTSHPGRGTRFDIALPDHAPLPAGDLSQLRVLVVDDAPQTRTVVEEFVAHHGCQVITASDGREAVIACVEHRPDVVIMDRHMPELDGVAAAHLIRSRLPSENPPKVVIVTADPHALSAITRGDVDACLLKPLSLDMLNRLLTWVERDDGSTFPWQSGALQPNSGLDPAVIDDLRATIGPGGESMLNRIARKIIEDNRNLLEELDVAIVRERHGEGRRIAHRISGNCALVGARETGAVARGLEYALEQGGSPRVDGLFAELGASCRMLETLLREASALSAS